MGKLLNFVIIYDHPQGVYRAGDVLKGQVKVELADAMRMRNIRLLCQGKAKVHWTKTRRSGKNSHTVHYRQDEVYFEELLPIFGTEHGESTLEAGSHHFDFQIQLNQHLPSSFEGEYGYVRYICKATIDKPWKFDYDTKTAFTVISHLDLNLEPAELKTAMQGEESSKVSCCCCISGDVHASFSINRQGFVPGECILINATVQNRSNTSVEGSRVSIKQYTEFFGKSDAFLSSGMIKSKCVSCYITTKERGAIPAGESDSWVNEPLLIPALPPSRLVGCDIINISYVIKACLCALREAFAAIPSQYPPVPATVTSQPATIHPPIQYDSEGWQIPPPSYEMHHGGKVHIKEEEDTEYTHGEMHWAPSYPFYRQLSLESAQILQEEPQNQETQGQEVKLVGEQSQSTGNSQNIAHSQQQPWRVQQTQGAEGLSPQEIYMKEDRV